MNPLNVYANERLAEAIKLSLDLGEINLKDLLEDDDCILELLKNSKSSEVVDLIESINENVKVVEDKEHYDLCKKHKVRTINPDVYVNGKTYKISEISEEVNILNKKALEKSREGVFIKVK